MGLDTSAPIYFSMKSLLNFVVFLRPSEVHANVICRVFVLLVYIIQVIVSNKEANETELGPCLFGFLEFQE